MAVIAILVFLAVLVVGRIQRRRAERAAASVTRPPGPVPHEPTADERARGRGISS